MPKTAFNMNFNFKNGYYGYVPNGYQGFDFSELYYFDPNPLIVHPHNTGYENDLHGRGEAFDLAEYNVPNGYGWGAFYSPGKETFTLRSGDIASAWDQEQSVKFTTYRGTKIVASVYIVASIYGQKVDFAKYGNDFKDITKVRFETNAKYAVNESGYYGKGWQIVLDNVKGIWNGPKPQFSGTQHHAHITHPLMAALAHGSGEISAAPDSHAHAVSPGTAFHCALTSPDTLYGHHDSGGLTSEFILPGTEHFA